MFSGRARKEN